MSKKKQKKHLSKPIFDWKKLLYSIVLIVITAIVTALANRYLESETQPLQINNCNQVIIINYDDSKIVKSVQPIKPKLESTSSNSAVSNAFR